MAKCPEFNMYSCCLIVAGCICQFIIYGTMYSSGAIYVIFLECLDYTSAPLVAFGVGLSGAATELLGPCASIFVNRFGCRITGIIGGLIASLGMLLTSFSSHVYNMTAMFGLLCGIGMSFANVSMAVAISSTFHKYRPIAMGITSTFVSIGSFCYPPLARYTMVQYGWRGMLLIMSGVMLHLVVAASLYRPSSAQRSRQSSDADSRIEKHKSLVNIHLLKKIDFMLLNISGLLLCIGFSAFYVHLAAFAQSLGIDKDRSAFLLSTVGAAGIVSRLAWGALNQLRWCTGFTIHVFAFCGCGLVMLFLPLARTYLAMQVACAVFGLLASCNYVATIDILSRMLGPSMMSSGFGYFLLFSGVGQALGAPIAGLIYEQSGNYAASIWFGGAIFISSAAVMIPVVYCSCQYGDNQEQRNIKAEDVEQKL